MHDLRRRRDEQTSAGKRDGCATILLAAMLTTPAAARIQCRGNFQMTKYGPIATPYCEEEQIAFVARSHGQRVTAAEVHNNPLTKVYLCQTIGYDFSVEGILCGLRTGLLRPRSSTMARTRGVLNDCPTRHPARLRRSWSRTSVARGSAKDGLRVWAWSADRCWSRRAPGRPIIRSKAALGEQHVLGQGVARPFRRLSDTTHAHAFAGASGRVVLL